MERTSLALRHGIFMAAFHVLEEGPTMCLHRDLELCEWLDRLGFDEAWIGEHHSAGFETISSPELFIAHAAATTKHLRFGTGVVSLPYHNPLMVANRIIQLDHMTRGRVMFGAGPGLLASDAMMLGIDPSTQRDRMLEALDAILRLFRGEVVTETTEWYTLVNARVHLLPYTRPHPEVSVASAVSPSGGRAAGRYDLSSYCVILCWPSHMSSMARAMEGAAGPRRSEARFAAYLDEIGAVLGHASRAAAARAYCTGLLLPGARKSVEPMAARIEPGRVGARHQSLHHVVAKAEWDDAAVLAAVRRRILPALQRHGPVRYWIVDDTGFPKQGGHSVGVARQYCGQLGKQDNCQVAVSLSVANDHASLPIAHRLYLPETWAGEPERCARAGVPEEVAFETKPEIALGQIRSAQAEGVPPGVVLGDAGYGVETAFRAALAEAGLTYVLGVQSSASLWPPGEAPLPVPPYGGRGRPPPPTRVRRAPGHQPVSAKKLAEGLPARAWRSVTWREGSRTALTSRFAALRVRPAHRDTLRSEPWPEEWLLVEWPKGAAEPAKYWLSNLPPRTALRELVRTAKARWLIERDYQELKQEIGLGHYEGRGWRGFHHHASLRIAAYGFLVAERCLFPPARRFTRRRLAAPALPGGFRPRGAADPT